MTPGAILWPAHALQPLRQTLGRRLCPIGSSGQTDYRTALGGELGRLLVKAAWRGRRTEKIDACTGRPHCLIVRRAPAEATRLASEIRRLGDRNPIIEE
jgi:hypothetical protein